MKNGKCFEGDSIFNLHRLKVKSVRLTLDEIKFIEGHRPGKDFSYNLRTILEDYMSKARLH